MDRREAEADTQMLTLSPILHLHLGELSDTKRISAGQGRPPVLILDHMRVASSQPHPYLLNQAGGICKVKEFSLVNGQLSVVPVADDPITGEYQLIYRCDEHELSDIKRAVSSDGTSWSVAEPLSHEEDHDVCYPGPGN